MEHPSPDGTPCDAGYERHHKLSHAFEASYGGQEPAVDDDPRVAYVEDPRAAEPDFGAEFVRVGDEWHHRTGTGWCPCLHPGATGAPAAFSRVRS
jgi:hypothetical protein